MDLTEQLRSLEAAQGDPARLSLAAVDLAFPTLAEEERADIKEALKAAAIPHWCDAAILAAMLGLSTEESTVRLAQLRRLSLVEAFPARGSDAVNVHEASRLALRKLIDAEANERFRSLSASAAEFFKSDSTPAGRIEWIYHLLCADPEIGATTLETNERLWSRVARPEDRYALSLALEELDNTGLVRGRARVWALIVKALARVSRGEAARLAHLADEVLDLAGSLDDRRALREALTLSGDVQLAQRKPMVARKSYEEALVICRELAELDPSNTASQQDLGVAYNRVGWAHEAQGNLSEAKSAFESALEIAQWLAERQPGDASCQSDVAVAHNRVGGVLEAQGDLSGARASFYEAVVIARGLAEQDPNNAGWQAALAMAQNRMGGVFEAEGNLPEARAALDESLAIYQWLAERDAHNMVWQSDLALAYNRVGASLEASGTLGEAQAAFEEAFKINRRLVEQNPGNAEWQRDLAIACWRIARSHCATAADSDALPYYEQAYAILDGLSKGEAAAPDWVNERDLVQSEFEQCRLKVEMGARG